MKGERMHTRETINKRTGIQPQLYQQSAIGIHAERCVNVIQEIIVLSFIVINHPLHL